MEYLSGDLLQALHRALEAFRAEPSASTSFMRCWSAVGELEDYAAVAATPAERKLVALLRVLLEKRLRASAPYTDLPDARGVEAFLNSPPRRRKRFR